jgi:hypothetical protein
MDVALPSLFNVALSIMLAILAPHVSFFTTERRSTVVAGLTSCALFSLGSQSLPSVIPFAIIIDDPFDGLIAAANSGMNLTIGKHLDNPHHAIR